MFRGMSNSENFRLLDEGRELNALLTAVEGGSPNRFEVILHNRGGAGPEARNTEYNRALAVLLERLGQSGAELVTAKLAARTVLHLSESIRTLRIERRPYPIRLAAIGDFEELRLAVCRAQNPEGTSSRKKGTGNQTRTIQLDIHLPDLASGRQRKRLSVSEFADALRTATFAKLTEPVALPVGQPYQPADEHAEVPQVEPFPVDPKVVERGLRGHAKTQNALAAILEERGIPIYSPSQGPAFDLAWIVGGVLCVAEVKSLTDDNEERQLRLGLGQVLRYRHLLASTHSQVRAFLVAERRPTDGSWDQLCEALGVRLMWPEVMALRVFEPKDAR